MKKISSGLLCFFGGDFLVTLFTLLYGGEITHFMLKIFSTIIIGVIGGVAGLAGKDLYPMIKQKIKTKFTKNKKSQL